MSTKKQPIDLNDPRLRAIERQPRSNTEIVAALQALGRSGSESEQKQIIAMSVNRDPFNMIDKSVHVERAEWFMGIWRKFGLQPGVHLRGIHYILVSQKEPFLKPDGEPYENRGNNNNYLSDCSVSARVLGHIGWDDIIDQRNPEPQIFRSPPPWFFSQDTPEISCGSFSIDSIGGLPAIDMSPFSAHISPPSIRGYSYSSHYQPYHIEIWCEKSTMADVIVPICREYEINYWGGMGFTSPEQIKDMVERARAIGKPTIIFYISDLDRAGTSMPVQVARYTEWFRERAPDIKFKLMPICLTPEQVKLWDLPSVPLQERAGKRSKHITQFELLYGSRKVELDALEALHPGELRKIILEAVLPYRDLNLPEKYEAAYDKATRMVNAAWKKRTEPIEDALKLIDAEVNPIIADFQERYQELREELAARLEPYNEQINSKLHAVEEITDELRNEIDLPPTPEPETNPPQRDWLLDTNRGWVDQLAAYKRTHSGEIEDESA